MTAAPEWKAAPPASYLIYKLPSELRTLGIYLGALTCEYGHDGHKGRNMVAVLGGSSARFDLKRSQKA